MSGVLPTTPAGPCSLERLRFRIYGGGGRLRVLITGGAGFIGSNLVRRLLSEGHDPVILDDFSTGLAANLVDLDVRVFQGTLADHATLLASARDSEAIVHLGARGSVPRSIADPLATHVANATGTLNVLEVARQTGAYVVFSSSSSVYGANPLLPKTERTWTQPMSPYAASKLAGEGYLMAYRESYGLSALALRFFNVFGPWQRPDHDYAAVVPKWLHRALLGEVIEIHGDGLQTRDFTFVESVVDVLADALQRRISLDTPVNLAFGRPRSLLQVVEDMERLLGLPLRTRHLPSRIGDVHASENDPGLLLSTFPSVQPTEFTAGLAKTAEWLQAPRSIGVMAGN